MIPHPGFQFKTSRSFHVPFEENYILRLIVNGKNFDEIPVAQKGSERLRLIFSLRGEVEVRGYLFLMGFDSFHLHPLEVALKSDAAGRFGRNFLRGTAPFSS